MAAAAIVVIDRVDIIHAAKSSSLDRQNIGLVRSEYSEMRWLVGLSKPAVNLSQDLHEVGILQREADEQKVLGRKKDEELLNSGLALKIERNVIPVCQDDFVGTVVA